VRRRDTPYKTGKSFAVFQSIFDHLTHIHGAQEKEIRHLLQGLKNPGHFSKETDSST
jgi:hypothetical protein